MDTVVEKTVFTPEDLLHMPDGKHYELVNGQLVEQDMSLEASSVALRIGSLLSIYVDQHELGGVFDSTASFQCFPDAPTKIRRPDVSFIHRDRLREEYLQGHCPIAPDLAVEVASPTDYLYEVYEKITDYRTAGVRLIWLFNPQTETVQVFERQGPLRELLSGDDLEGADVVPGFRCRVERFFRRPAMTASQPTGNRG